MSLIQELNKCHLPIRITNGSNILNVTAYNNSAVLYVNKDGKENYMPIIYLNGFDIYQEKEKVTLYKYTYFDKTRNEEYKTEWTTEKWHDYMPQNNNFESISFKQKTIEIEDN